MKKIFLIITFTLSIIFSIGCQNIRNTTSRAEIDNALSPQLMKEDLDFVIRSLYELHPKFKNKDFSVKYDAKIKEIYKEAEKPLSKDSFYLLVQKSLAIIQDAHTTAVNDDTNVLPINLQWAGKDLVITNDSDKIKKGSKILSIGGKNISKLCEELGQYISSENEFWVRAQTKDLLKRKLYLDMLKATNDNKVIVRIEDNLHKVEDIELEFLKSTKSNWKPYDFEITKETGLAVLTLNECIYDNDFTKQLDNFFEELHTDNISKLAIDMRKNVGGNIKCAEAILTYFNADKYSFPAGEDRYDLEHVKNIWTDKKRMFQGKTYILVSNSTFSAGSAFADIFKCNKLATLIGETTGNAPSFYADPVTINLPNLKIKCSISTKYILGADKNDKSNAVIPDVQIALDTNDIISCTDPALKYVKASN